MASDDSDTPFDSLLAGMVFLAEQGGTASVTLAVDGILVSGMLIGTLAYLDRLRDILDQEGTLGTVQFSGGIQAALDRAADRPPVPDSPVNFVPSVVSLADVTLILAGGARVMLPLWSARFSAISGWRLGLLELRQDDASDEGLEG